MAAIRFILSRKAKIHLTYLGAGDLQDLVKLGQYITTEHGADRLVKMLLALDCKLEKKAGRKKQVVIKVDARGGEAMKLGDLIKKEWRIRKQRGRGERNPMWVISAWNEEDEIFDTIAQVYGSEGLANAIMAIKKGW